MIPLFRKIAFDLLFISFDNPKFYTQTFGRQVAGGSKHIDVALRFDDIHLSL